MAPVQLAIRGAETTPQFFLLPSRRLKVELQQQPFESRLLDGFTSQIDHTLAEPRMLHGGIQSRLQMIAGRVG